MYEYFSNGAGVAVGDLDGDGLDDVYFTGNMTYNRLYLNKGNLVFEDVTSAAGVAGRRNTWKTGATMVDVNGDGLLDVYVCYSGELPLDRRVDELYINQGTGPNGVPRFEERASEYGLANPHSSNQAYFFDHDRDGDLDLFLQTHNVRTIPRRNRRDIEQQLNTDDPVNGVRFYVNNDGYFEDQTSQVGIQSSALTYGLGAGVSDVNRDGWPDMYVGNDYSAPDYLYINNGDGTFTDERNSSIGHTSRASMGVDVADINNDALPDISVLDMLAETNRRQKILYIPNNRESFNRNVSAGFGHQYMRNTLQVNNGDGTFSEIGQLAGVSNTDWSWAPLIADYDNDGWKDLYVTNGILHDISNRDFIRFRANYLLERNYDLEPRDIGYLMEVLPSSTLENYVFRNVGGVQFNDVSSQWGLAAPLKSTGAAFADLDADGDLDLITNNINEQASVFENRTAQELGNNHLQVDLRGSGGNAFGIGAKVTLYADGNTQFVEQMPTRGYLSSVSPTLHFGLGQHTRADSLQVIWPDGSEQTIRGIDANQRLSVRERNAVEVNKPSIPTNRVFEAVPSPVEFEHQMEAGVDDFRRQSLMVNPKSFSGPALAQADVNGDSLQDVFAGGGSGQASMLYVQQQDGQFVAASQPAFEADRSSNDVDAVFLDYNGDGHLDLYVASGGYDHYAHDDAALQDRLYVNDGNGNFSRREDALPVMRASTGAVTTTDINSDGWPDLFVGGRVVPGRYPAPPRSYLLVNDREGHYQDVTAEVGPELQQIGMVSDAAWHDLNRNGTEELIVVGEWMPIGIFANEEGRLSNETDSYFEQPYSGLWNAVHVDDVNADGKPDLLVGNLGLNAQIEASEDQPAELYYADFNRDGSIDPILNFSIQGTSYPHATLDELRDQIPSAASRFSTYEAYAEAKMEDVFTDRELEASHKLEAQFLETALFIANPEGQFERVELPIQAQFSPIFTINTLDYDRDGNRDLLLGGNISEAQIRLGKYDANYGVLLRGVGAAAFEYVPQYESGLSLRGDIRSVLEVDGMFLFGTNRGAIKAYQLMVR